ncbi:hypothetical protein VaNZ11_006851 [Volvox africanus]|uniref:Uncharacterized protein n=1 Tax=Volvox africanus TaxID=51714 RepID=A0ABQ5S2A0_9CHLO|nr:hypothetical protein VaNZ11_006851 [Volvox africanus]
MISMSLTSLVTLLAVGLSTKALGSHVGCEHPHGQKRLELYGKIDFTHKIRTSKPDVVQPLFDLGFLLAAGYNQPEARRAFRDALNEDNLCAMCWWGVAYARGPFQNKFAMPPIGTEIKDPDIGSSDYYSSTDFDLALNATKIAADLVGLVPWSEADSTLNQIQSSPEKGLMSMLPTCNAPAGRRRQMLLTHLAPGNGAAPHLVDANPPVYGSHSPASPTPYGGTTSSPRPPFAKSEAPPNVDTTPSAKLLLINRERYYIAAMFDRLSSLEWYGKNWEAAERRYAENMIEVANCFPDDANALALAAEALANLSPWDFAGPAGAGTKGSLPENTKKIITLLQSALQRDPKNPLALHLMIHVTEELPARKSANKTDYAAGLGLESALQLLGMFPTLDHMQHMPSHTFVRVGLWKEAVESNVLSLRASVHASANCLSTLYADHNVAMLVFAASMGAQYEKAQVYARVLRELPRFISDSQFSVVGSQWTAPLLVYVRFANWTKVAVEKPPPVDASSWLSRLQALPGKLQAALGVKAPSSNDGDDVFDDVTLDAKVKPAKRPDAMTDNDYYRRKPRDGPEFAMATWLYAQFMAVASATFKTETEKLSLLEDVKTSLKSVVDNMLDDAKWGKGPGPGLGVLVPGYKLMADVMLKMADARLKWVTGKKEEALTDLKACVELEDKAGYTEPPRLAQQPVRQCLGHLYFKAQQYKEASQVYIEDLNRYPGNPWSLKGLWMSIRNSELKDVAEILPLANSALEAAQSNVDQLPSSCPAFD